MPFSAPSPDFARTPSHLSESGRQILLGTIDFIREELLSAERHIRSLYEHVKWVRNEVGEVFTAENTEHRREEIGDVIMILLRLSCFKNPEKSSREILDIYESNPSFLRYVEQIGESGLASMYAKFAMRYGFLSDPQVQSTLFPEWHVQWKWLQEVMWRMFAVEKSKEPGKSPASQDFFSETIVLSDADVQKCDALGIAEHPMSRKHALWIVGLLDGRVAHRELVDFFSVLSPARLRDERFVRMVYLDHQNTGDIVAALWRVLMLVADPIEIASFLDCIEKVSNDQFIEEFLQLQDNRASMMYFREYLAAYRFFREQGFGSDSMEFSDHLVIQWMVFHETEADYDLLECIESMRSDERLQEIADMDTRYVTICTMLHRYRREYGVYSAVDQFGRNVVKQVAAHLKTEPDAVS